MIGAVELGWIDSLASGLIDVRSLFVAIDIDRSGRPKIFQLPDKFVINLCNKFEVNSKVSTSYMFTWFSF